MKKSNLTLVSLYVIAGAIAFIAPSCSKKDDEVLPNITSVTSSVISLGNDESATKEGYLVSTGAKASVNSAFDIAYGNGSAVGNKFFLGGSEDESIIAVYGLGNARLEALAATTEFKYFDSASGVTTAVFDSLINQKAVETIYAKGTLTAAATGNVSSRIKSETAWTVGTVFAFKTVSGTIVIAKVTTAPTGSATTAGSIGLTLKK